MAESLGARVPYNALPDDASQPKLADGSGLSKELLLDGATAALSAIEAMGAVVVPVEATDKMDEAGWVRLCDHTHLTAEDIYAVMLAASPFAKGSTP
jgi:hypothetical protein